MQRRTFLKNGGVALAGMALAACANSTSKTTTQSTTIANLPNAKDFDSKHLLTISQLNREFQAGTNTPSNVLAQSLEKAKKSTSVFTLITDKHAHQLAQEADVRLKAGKRLSALDGIPVSWKDLYDQKGFRTTAGSHVYDKQPVKKHDAVTVAQLESAGAVSMGRTNLTEFAFSGLGLNPFYGTPANVWSQSEALAPGGSSSGAAISVANGMVAFAMGTDTAGSIRIPSALNGLVGFKPTAERVSRIGVWALSPTMDCLGPLAHTVEDVCTIMKTFAINADKTPSRSLKVVVPTGTFVEDVEEPTKQAFEQSLARLKQAGIEVIRKKVNSVSRLETLFGEYGPPSGIESLRLYQDILAQQGNQMDPRVSKRMLNNAKFPLSNLAELLHWRARLKVDLLTELQGAMLLIPTTALDAPSLKRLQDDDKFYADCNVKMLRNTTVASFLDMPSLSVPSGLNSNNLPASVLISGVSGTDEEVLQAGRYISRVLTGDVPLNLLRFK